MLIQYLLDSTYIVLEYTNTVIHTNGKKQCSGRKHESKFSVNTAKTAAATNRVATGLYGAQVNGGAREHCCALDFFARQAGALFRVRARPKSTRGAHLGQEFQDLPAQLLRGSAGTAHASQGRR
jgi:hypothetical protein